MSMEDVRDYESKLQTQTNSLISNHANGDPATTTDSINDVECPTTPKSPAKRGYFSWF